LAITTMDHFRFLTNVGGMTSMDDSWKVALGYNERPQIESQQREKDDFIINSISLL